MSTPRFFSGLFALVFSTAVIAESAPPLELSVGWYEGYQEVFLDYKGLEINEDGNHRLVTSHLSWGMGAFRNINFGDEDMQCSSVNCVIEIPEPDHEGHLNRLVLAPSPVGGWYVMQTSAEPDGELVLTNTYELRQNEEGSDGYAFTSRYQETLENLQQPDDASLDGLWIGVRTGDTSQNLVALEYSRGEPATLVTFLGRHVGELEFPAERITTSEYTLNLSTQQRPTEHRITLTNQINRRLVGYVELELANGLIQREAIKLIRVRPL